MRLRHEIKQAGKTWLLFSFTFGRENSILGNRYKKLHDQPFTVAQYPPDTMILMTSAYTQKYIIQMTEEEKHHIYLYEHS